MRWIGCNSLLSGTALYKSGRKVADEDSKSMFFDKFDVQLRKIGKRKNRIFWNFKKKRSDGKE